MSDSAEPKRPRRRRADPAELRRSGLDRIGAELGEAIPPPEPPGLGEGMLERAATRDGRIEGLLGQLLERSLTNGETIRETREQVDRLDSRFDEVFRTLNGVAYRKDIEHFMPREEIERKIEKAVDGVKKEVASLRGIGWGIVSAILLGVGGFFAKAVLSAVHLPI